jgi:ribosomal protein S8
MNYTPADIAVRFNVGYSGLNKSIVLSNTKIALALVTVLYKQGLISSFQFRKTNIVVVLKYSKNKPLFKSIKVISTPGYRVY